MDAVTESDVLPSIRAVKVKLVRIPEYSRITVAGTR
jgi:hypothetical protein